MEQRLFYCPFRSMTGKEGKTMIEIYWDDLTEEKQAELLELFGDNCNWDVIPIAVIPGPEQEPRNMDIPSQATGMVEPTM